MVSLRVPFLTLFSMKVSHSDDENYVLYISIQKITIGM